MVILESKKEQLFTFYEQNSIDGIRTGRLGDKICKSITSQKTFALAKNPFVRRILEGELKHDSYVFLIF